MPPKAIINLATIDEEGQLLDRASTKSFQSSVEIKTSRQLFFPKVLEEQPRPQKKTVSFCPFPDIQEIDRIDDLKAILDVKDLWYSNDEYKSIHMECQMTVHLMNIGYDVPDEKRHCTRGLESLTIHGRQRYRDHASAAARVVLKEQRYQRIEGIYDLEYLADMYFERSWQSQVDSLNQGNQDHQEVVAMQFEESRVINMISKLAFL